MLPRLNEYVLLEIFKYLPIKKLLIIQRVCKKWQELIYHIIRQIEYLNVQDLGRVKFTDKSICRVLSLSGANLKKISIINNCTNKTLYDVGKHCENITELDIYSDTITNSGLISVSVRCKHLKSVKLNGKCITKLGLRHIFKNCKHLQEICVGWHAADDWFEYPNKSLEIIRIKNRFNITGVAIRRIKNNYPNLIELEIIGLSIGIMWEIGKLTKLKKLCLDLQYCEYYDDVEIYEMFVNSSSLSNLTSLESFTLIAYFDFSNDILYNLPNTMREIYIINSRNYYFDNESIEILSWNCPHLTSITLVLYSGFNDYCVMLLSQLKYLTDFNIIIYNSLNTISTKGIAYLIKKSHSIQNIGINTNDNLSILPLNHFNIQTYINGFNNAYIDKLNLVYYSKVHWKYYSEILKEFVIPMGLNFIIRRSR